MPISDEKKLIFIHIPKNAGTSIEKQLNMRATGHKPWYVYANSFTKEWNIYRSFAIVRNPFDRLVSNYEYAKMDKSYWHSANGDNIYGKHPDYEICKKNSFSQIVDILGKSSNTLSHDGWKPQYPWICDNSLTIKINHVIKYEDIDIKLKELGICEEGLQKLNVSTRKDHSQYYDYKTIEKVKMIYEEDFNLFYKEEAWNEENKH